MGRRSFGGCLQDFFVYLGQFRGPAFLIEFEKNTGRAPLGIRACKRTTFSLTATIFHDMGSPEQYVLKNKILNI